MYWHSAVECVFLYYCLLNLYFNDCVVMTMACGQIHLSFGLLLLVIIVTLNLMLFICPAVYICIYSIYIFVYMKHCIWSITRIKQVMHSPRGSSRSPRNKKACHFFTLMSFNTWIWLFLLWNTQIFWEMSRWLLFG